MRPAVGFTLQPSTEYLDLLEPIADEHADVIEVAPETLWRFDRAGAWSGNAFFERIRAFGASHGKRFIAHGVGWSPGSAELSGSERERRWLDAIARTHAAFAFEWYTDHLGATVWNGEELLLPLPLPMTPAAVATVRERMARIAALGLDVGVENSVFYFRYGSVVDEADFVRAITVDGCVHLLLDLHNVFTTCVNAGVDPREYVERLPLERVIELHVSGGSDSDPVWLRSGKTRRLDSHDRGVPEPVWELLRIALPRCVKARAVVLERMEGTVSDADVGPLRDELVRVRAEIDAVTR